MVRVVADPSDRSGSRGGGFGSAKFGYGIVARSIGSRLSVGAGSVDPEEEVKYNQEDERQHEDETDAELSRVSSWGRDSGARGSLRRRSRCSGQ